MERVIFSGIDRGDDAAKFCNLINKIETPRRKIKTRDTKRLQKIHQKDYLAEAQVESMNQVPFLMTSLECIMDGGCTAAGSGETIK